MPRRRLVALPLVLGLLAAPAPAQAQRLGSLVQALSVQAPLAGGVVQSATGAAGGLLPAQTAETLGELEQVLGTVPAALPGSGVPGAGQGQGDQLEVLGEALGALPPTASGGALVDLAAPTVTFEPRSTLKRVHKTGALRLRVRLGEPGVVVLGGQLRPGARVKGARGPHTRALVRVPPAVLAFRRAGTLNVVVQLGRDVRRNLLRSRDARLKVTALAADQARNLAPLTEKVRLKR